MILNFEENKKEMSLQFKAEGTKWIAEEGTLTPEEIWKKWLDIKEGGHPAQPLPIEWAEMVSYMYDRIQLSVMPCHCFLYRMNYGRGMFKCRDYIWNRLGEKKNIFGRHLLGDESYAYWCITDFSHTSPDWDNVLKLGFPGMLDRINEAKEKKQKDGSLTDEEAVFYTSTATVLKAIIRLISRYAKAARDCGTPTMLMAAEAMEQLAVGAPRNTYEALEMILFYHYMQNYTDGEIVRSCGRLDALLLPYYENDIKTGRFTEEEISEMLKYWMYTFSCANITANLPFSLGGVTPDGRSSFSHLTEVIIDAYRELNEISPKIHILVTKDTPKEILRKVCRHIRDGISSFVFMGDETVTKSLMHLDRPIEEARNYVLIGCYEPATVGKELACTAAGAINMLKAVEYAMNEGFDHVINKQVGAKTPPLSELNTYDKFYDAVKTQLLFLCSSACEYLGLRESLYKYLITAPVISATMDECVERGKAAYFGGVKYGNSSICAYALASAADSVAAVKKAVYEDKTLSLERFSEILRNNWEGEEKLRLKIKKTYPKFGNNNDYVDLIAKDLSTVAMDAINGVPNVRGGVYRAGMFSIDWYMRAGETSLASPDGRLFGAPVSKNLCAELGADKCGATALILSNAKLEHEKCADGNVLDLMLHTTAVAGEAGIDAMVELVNTYIDNGGYALQMNVLDCETLKKAKAAPEKYSTLQIRLCGWNVFFTSLSPELQDDLIRRAKLGA